MRIRLVFGILFICGLFASCKQKSLYPDQYVQWVLNPDNGLRVVKEMIELDFELIYKPIEFKLIQEFGEEIIDANKFEERKKELTGYEYFNFRITSKVASELLVTNIHSQQEFDERLNYFVGDAQNDFSLVQDGDTIPCSIYHFERNYGIAPYNTMVLAFKSNGDNLNDKKIIYHDRVFGNGPIILSISKESLKKLPQIKLR